MKLIQVCEKEQNSKRKYRNSATVLKKEMNELQFEMKTLREKNQTLEEISREMMANGNASSGDSEAEKELKKEVDRQRMQIENLQGELSLYRGKGQQLQEMVADLSEQNRQLEEKNRSGETELASQKVLIQSLESQKDSLSKTIRLMEEQMNQGAGDQSAVIQHMQSEKEVLEQRATQFEAEIAVLKGENERLQQEVTATASKASDLSRANEMYESLQTEHLRLKASLEAEQKRSQDLSEELQNAVKKSEAACVEVETAKKKIEEMEKTIQQNEENQKELTEILKNNKQKAKDRIRRLQSTNLEAEQSAKKESELWEEERSRMQSQIQSLSQLVENMTKEHKAELDAIVNQGDESKSKMETLEKQAREQKDEIEIMKREQQFMVMKLSDKEQLTKELSDTKQKNTELMKEIEDLRVQLFTQKTLTTEHERAHNTIAEAIDDKNATINKLKTLLSRAVKSEQRKQQEIDAIESDRKQLLERFTHLSSSQDIFQKDTDSFSKPDNDPQIEELINQNKKLHEMLETSSRLFSELQEKHRHLKRQMQHPQCHIESFPVFECLEHPDTKRKLKRMTDNAKKEARLVKSAYLRRVLLQYFSQEEDSDRNMMIPMILELVGCTKEQISMVMRQIERNQQLIARTAGFFGLLK